MMMMIYDGDIEKGEITQHWELTFFPTPCNEYCVLLRYER